MRLIDADALKEDLTRFYAGEVTARNLIDEQPTIGGWISVEERLPEGDGDYLVYTREEYTGIFWFDRDDKEWIEESDFPCVDGYVTHWMPRPEPPKKDQ